MSEDRGTYDIFLLDIVARELKWHIAYDGKDEENGKEIGDETKEGELGGQWNTENLVLIQSSTEHDNGEDEMQHEEGE